MLPHFPCLFRISLLLLVSTLGMLPAQTWTTVDYPSAAGTQLRAINNRGHLLGEWLDSSNRWHGFFQNENGMSQINCDGALQTRPHHMNNRGEIVGRLQDAAGKWHGFYIGELGGPCFEIDPKGSVGAIGDTGAFGISDGGEIVGQFDDASGRTHAYLMRGEVYLLFDIVEGPWNGAFGITPNGDIFGHLQANGDRMKGFFLTKEKLNLLEFPPGEQNTMTCGFGGNSKGDLVGHYQRTGGQVRGFLLAGGKFIEVDVPDAIYTHAAGINDVGAIVGFYRDKANVWHGFVRRP